MSCLCPTCNRPMEATRAPIEGLTSAVMGPIERRIVEALVRAYPRSITRDRMVDIVYADERDGGPDRAQVIMSILMGRLRPKLVQFGWTIPKARSGKGSEGYHLEPVA
jgi:hypothetical protein